MATRNVTVPTILDVTRTLNPDGTQAEIAEILMQTNEALEDIPWYEGNLITGDRFTVRNSLPSVAFRRLNEGVPRSKSTSRQIDEAAAMLEANSMVDRKLAILSQNPAKWRINEATAFIEAMNNQFSSTLFYGNSDLNETQFTGFAPRYNNTTNNFGNQVIDCLGSGTDNRSIWLIGWGENTVAGIYPKGTVGGLMHMDTTSNLRLAPDGFPIGDEILDASGNPYYGYKDHYEWNMGLRVKDGRYIVRAANIDYSDLSKTVATGIDIQDVMVQMLEKIQGLTPSTAFYVPRAISAMLRRQLLNSKNGFLSLEEVGGRKVTTFDGIPIRRMDALAVDETRVTSST